MTFKFVCLKTTAAFLQTLCLSPHTDQAHAILMKIGCPVDKVYKVIEAPTLPALSGTACEGWEPVYTDEMALKPYEWEWSEGQWRRYIGQTVAIKRVRYLGGAQHDSEEHQLGIY